MIDRLVKTIAHQLGVKSYGGGSIHFSGGWQFLGMSAITPERSWIANVSQGYKKNADVYSAVRLIARSLKTIPYYFVKVDKNGDDVRYNDNRLSSEFARPNPRVIFSYWVEQMATDILLGGDAISGLVRTGVSDKKVTEWLRLRPDFTTIELNNQGDYANPIKSYNYQAANGYTHKFEPSDVLHWMFFNPLDEFRGLSPLEAAVLAVYLGNAGMEWNAASMQNMGAINGILKFKNTLTQEQMDQITQRFEERHAGASKAGKPLVLDEEMEADFQPTGQTMKDADWLSGMKFSKAQIAAVYNIDPVLIGDNSSSTYNNVTEAKLRMYYDVVIPMATELEELINACIVSTWDPNVRFRFDIQAIEALKKEQASAYDRLTSAWYLTPNERRAELGYEILPGKEMDTIFIPSGQIPISEASIDVTVLPDGDAD